MIFTLSPTAWSEDYGEDIVSLDAVRAHCRVDGEDEDDLLTALRDAAINMVEQYAGVRLAPLGGLVATFPRFGTGMRIGIGPASTLVVTGIRWRNSEGAATDLAAGDWRVDPSGALVPGWGKSWPAAAEEVSVTFNVGFGAGECPPALVTAVKMFTAHLFANRESVITGTISGEIPLGFRMLCDQYREPVL